VGRKNGLTMVEMMAVLMVLAIMMAVVLPLAVQAGQWQLKTAAAGLASDIRETRHKAIVEGVNCYLVFYEFTGRYKLMGPEGSSWVSLPQGVSYAANNFPLSMDNRPTLYFRHTGAPNRGGHVGLKDKEGNKLYVIVTPVTGRVRIDKVPP
jgi:prepilin-type N-terminal cleavage/methylation domain-containing protein